MILAIDEYPYAARSSKSLASTLQFLVDRYKDRSKWMLILCGPSMSDMEDNVLVYKAPLYGRRTSQMKIMPFDLAETCRCVQNFTDENKALVYGMVSVFIANGASTMSEISTRVGENTSVCARESFND